MRCVRCEREKRDSARRLQARRRIKGEIVRDACVRMAKLHAPLPMRTPLVALVLSLFVSVLPIPVFAQSPAAPAPAQAAGPVLVDVSNIRFAAARVDGATWLEAEVELTTTPGGRAVTNAFVDRVRVTLNLMFEVVGEGGAKKNSFYRSSVEAISLKGGKSSVRFYLPPEVVERDSLRPDLKYYSVDLEIDGRPLPPTRGTVSKDFASADSVKGFMGMVNAESGRNDGLLMPQYLTPFASDPRRPSPTLLRREAQR